MTLDDLIALNAEIGALVRAGVPLEQGLAELGADMPGTLGRVAANLAERTRRGESLEQALADHTAGLSPAYRAVVQAGIRAGRLPAALEAVAGSARRTAETQRAAIVAVSYPLLVFSLVWIGVAIFAVTLAPSLAASLRVLDIPVYEFFAAVATTGHWAWLWGPLVPILLAAFVFAWWRASTGAAVLHSTSGDRLFAWLPWMGRMLQCSRSAAFLDVLALLVENQTPLDEAITLAASASGDPKTIAAARRLTESIQNGQTQSTRLPGDPAFPPLMNWLMSAVGSGGVLVPALRSSADAYHRRAQTQSSLVRTLLPTLLTVVIAGSITTGYALLLFVPYIMMLKVLAK
jgi:type II secretory pathway component PulF